MQIFFTADLHLFHDQIALNTRPWKTTHEHDEAIISAINRVVGEDDRLYVLGDIAWRQPGVTLDRIICKNKHLIWGNHDRANYAKSFKSAEDVAAIKVGEDHVFLSHYPHAFWPGSHRGHIHLYGHTHAEAEEELEAIWPERRSMDVGVDNAFRVLRDYRPFSWDEVKATVGHRKGHHHVKGKSWDAPNTG